MTHINTQANDLFTYETEYFAEDIERVAEERGVSLSAEAVAELAEALAVNWDNYQADWLENWARLNLDADGEGFADAVEEQRSLMVGDLVAEAVAAA